MALSEKARENKAKYNEKYKKENNVNYSLHANKNTCMDIIEKLESVPSKQGYIFDLIRKDIENEQKK